MVFRVRLGYLSDFLSTSCITSLHFIPDRDEGKWVWSLLNNVQHTPILLTFVTGVLIALCKSLKLRNVCLPCNFKLFCLFYVFSSILIFLIWVQLIYNCVYMSTCSFLQCKFVVDQSQSLCTCTSFHVSCFLHYLGLFHVLGCCL